MKVAVQTDPLQAAFAESLLAHGVLVAIIAFWVICI